MNFTFTLLRAMALAAIIFSLPLPGYAQKHLSQIVSIRVNQKSVSEVENRQAGFGCFADRFVPV
jgi:hypothetical protein